MNVKIFHRLSFYIVSFTLALTITGMHAKAQTSVAERSFTDYRKQHFQEKLFVHTDKNNYLTGEIAWLKIYAVDASFHLPSALSTVAYVELLDASNVAVLSEKIGLENGIGPGSIYLPAILNSGTYKIRAYTNWMKNESADFFFEKAITVVNARRAYEAGPAPAKSAVAHFFAEGGNLVNGIESTVAFTVKDAAGNGITCSGTISDETNSTVANISTELFGTGTLNFTPVAGHTYKGIFAVGGFTVTAQLPAATDAGVVMHVVQNSGKTVVTIKAAGIGEDALPAVSLFIHCRQSIKKSVSLPLQNGAVSASFNNDELGEGINHITLFTSNGKPVCERLIFIYPKESSKLHMLAAKPVLPLRSRQVFTTSSEALTSANLSLSVYKTDSLQGIPESYIDDYLLLQSDLTGKIESPAYYFTNTDEKVIKAMDNLMLTNGWRRFKWDDVLSQKPVMNSFAPELAGQFVAGRVVDNANGKPVANKLAYLSIPGTKPFFQSCLSDSIGRVLFVVKDIYGAPGIIVQTDPEDSLYHIEITRPFATGFSAKPLPVFKMPLQQPKTMLAQNIAVQVRQVYGSTDINRFISPVKDTTPFYNQASETYLLDNYTRFTTVEEIFREYVPFIAVRKHNGVFSLPMYNEAAGNGSFDFDPLVLVDGIPVFNLNKVMALDPLKFNRIELITRKYYFGKASFNGIVNFSSYKGNAEGLQLDQRVTVIDYESLQLQREFYAPVYETDEQRSSHLPDFRYQLCWNPNIVLAAGETKKISFYTSDVKGKYVAILQGLTADGKPCKTVTSFEVE